MAGGALALRDGALQVDGINRAAYMHCTDGSVMLVLGFAKPVTKREEAAAFLPAVAGQWRGLGPGDHTWENEPTYELRLAKYAGRGFAVAVPGLQWHLVDRKAVNAALVDLKGLSRLLLLDAERSRALHQLRALNTPLPSLKHVFGRVRFFSNYGAHTRSRELPTQYHDARHLTNISWDNYMTDPGDATANAPDASAWWLVVPCHQLESEEVMNADARAEHWAIILDADRENLRIPRELEWSTTPRTREYLNAGEVGLEQRYFASVYSRRRSSGARRGRDSL